MQRKTRRIVIAVALIGALAAGGAAFTTSNTLPSENVAGYGHASVTGATVTDISNTLSTDGQNITKVVLTFQTALASNVTVKVGWNNSAGTNPTSLPTTCTLAADDLSATCGDGSTNLVSTVNAGDFAVAVYH